MNQTQFTRLILTPAYYHLHDLCAPARKISFPILRALRIFVVKISFSLRSLREIRLRLCRAGFFLVIFLPISFPNLSLPSPRAQHLCARRGLFQLRRRLRIRWWNYSCLFVPVRDRQIGEGAAGIGGCRSQQIDIMFEHVPDRVFPEQRCPVVDQQ
jgi:hypothetical protein